MVRYGQIGQIVDFGLGGELRDASRRDSESLEIVIEGGVCKKRIASKYVHTFEICENHQVFS